MEKIIQQGFNRSFCGLSTGGGVNLDSEPPFGGKPVGGWRDFDARPDDEGFWIALRLRLLAKFFGLGGRSAVSDVQFIEACQLVVGDVDTLPQLKFCQWPIKIQILR